MEIHWASQSYLSILKPGNGKYMGVELKKFTLAGFSTGSAADPVVSASS